MAQRKGQVEISVADAATAEVVEAFARLLPQLSSSAIPLTREALTLSAVNLAKQRGAKTVDLTSRQSRQAAHRLYEKSGFHVRDTSVYRFGPKPDA